MQKHLVLQFDCVCVLLRVGCCVAYVIHDLPSIRVISLVCVITIRSYHMYAFGLSWWRNVRDPARRHYA